MKNKNIRILFLGGILFGTLCAWGITKARLTKVINEAYQDEFESKIAYESVILQFGNLRPFHNIVFAEDRHMMLIEKVAQQHDIRLKEPKKLEIIKFKSVSEACKYAIKAEEENVKMYDNLIEQVEDESDVKLVFSQLRWASKENHIPAFRRCANQ